MPDEHTEIHLFSVGIKGPGWESDKVGYRFYLDWRNAADIFGKKVDTLVLQDVGQDGLIRSHHGVLMSLKLENHLVLDPSDTG